MIQKILSEQDTPITKMLPHGAITELAIIHGLNRITVSNILNGMDGYSSETTTKIVKSALEMIDEDSKAKMNYSKELKELIAA